MSIEHVTIRGDGRIVIPAAARKELGLKAGDTLVLESDGTSLLVRTLDSVLEETQAFFRHYTSVGESHVDALIADRRAEAEQEDAEEAVARSDRRGG